MPTINAWNSNIPVEIAKGGTNATSMTNTDGVCYFDGTSIVTTTVGTAGQVLTSNGAAVAPTFQDSVHVAKVTLTSAQIKALHGTPITVVAAQGANTVIWPIMAAYKFIYGGSNVFVAGASQAIWLSYGGTTHYWYDSGGLISNGMLVGSTTKFGFQTFQNNSGNVGIYDNVALVVYNSVATEITGNAANDNSVIIEITYRVANLT